jgi:DNA polymerase elongation subunit (family B)
MLGALTPVTAETNVEVHTELLLKLKIRPGGWLILSPSAAATAVESEGRTVCSICVQALTADLRPLQNNERMAPIRVLSYDIECYSESGAFPDASKMEDSIIAIGMYEKTLFSQDSTEKATVVYLGDATLPTDSIAAGHRVLCYQSESELLIAFGKLFRESDADVVVGYNTCLFDWRYISTRVELLKSSKILSPGAAEDIFRLSRVRMLHSPSVDVSIASSAMGDNPLHHPRMPGRFEVDLWFHLKRQNNQGLPNLKLNTVAVHYLGETKHDLPAQEMFARHRESAVGRGVVAAYCIQDTKLVLDLIEKLDVMQSILQMASVTSVIPHDINFRGQQIKVYTQILDKAHQLGYVVEDTGKNGGEGLDNREYEGAHVVDPTVGYYLDPILTLDFASLYPSLIQTYNLSFDTRVIIPDTKALSFQVPNTNHRFVASSVRRGLLPLILDELLAERKRVRTMAAKTDDKLQRSLLNCQQLALKMSANSCYGFTGSTKGILTCIEVAESTTGAGREIIHFSSETIEREWPGAKVVYGDSVTGDTPLIIRRRGGAVEILRIDELVDESESKQWLSSSVENDKEEAFVDVEVWQDDAFTSILRVIRHRCRKRIVRVVTRTGIVDCTEDHSLLSSNGSAVRPGEISVGSNLLHTQDSDLIETLQRQALVEEAPLISISEALAIASDNIGTRIPKELLNAPLTTISTFWSALVVSQLPSGRSVVMDKEKMAGLWLLARRLGYHPTFEPGEEEGFSHLVFDNQEAPDNPREIIQIFSVDGDDDDDEGYVYDLETSSHHFHVGPGNLVVHNTDSCFVRLPEHLRDLGEQQLFDLGEEMAERVTKDFAARLGISQQSYVSLEMEKFLRPLALYKKKRYVGLCYEEPGKPPKMCVKGIEMVRRDAAPILRKVQEQVLDAIIRRGDAEAGVKLAKDAVESILALPPGGPFQEVAQSKNLGAKYASPGSMSHVRVVELMSTRDPGSAPRVGERVTFVVIASETPRVVDKVEDVGYAEDESLPPDWTHYVEMLERPLMRLLDVPLMSLCPEKLRSLVIFFDNARARAKAQVRASSMARHGAGWLCGHRTTKGTQLKLVMMKAVDLTPSNNPTTTTSSVAASGADLSPRPMKFLGWQPISSDQASRLPVPKRRKATMASSSSSTPPKGTLDGWLAKKSLTENP